MKVYLAAPFFTPQQLRTVEAVEDVLRQCHDVHFYSPRQDGIVLKDLPEDERLEKAAEVFTTNLTQLDWCDVVLAIIDDRDTGTMIEVGYGVGKGKRIVTYTAHDYGLNVMLQGAVTAHVKTLPDLAYLFQKGLPDEICALFRTFHPQIT